MAICGQEEVFHHQPGRRYGKATTLWALAEYLKEEYIALSIDFQKMETEEFKDSDIFSHTFAKMCIKVFRNTEVENADELIKPIDMLPDEKKQLQWEICLSR